MYGFEPFLDITPEHIYQRVSQEQIFEFVLNEPFSFSSRYCSPFRKDHNPGCRFDTFPDGHIAFIDFAEKNIRPNKVNRTAIGMVMDYFQVSLTDALRIICKRFDIPLDSSQYVIPSHIVFRRDSPIRKKSFTQIDVVKKEFDRNDIRYWAQFIIKPEELHADKVSAIRSYSISGKRGRTTICPLKFSYVIDFVSRVKIYQPYRNTYKWITNCTENNVGNFDNLPPSGNRLIIQKSYKDHRILRNLNNSLNVIWFQNEGQIPDMEILSSLVTRFQTIQVFFDNDEPGILAANIVAGKLNELRFGVATTTHLPEMERHRKFYGKYLKDPGDYISREGRMDTIEALKQINIL